MSRSTFVYFVQIGNEDGPIKIGFTSRTAESRSRGVRSIVPGRKTLLLSVPGSRDDEALLHKRFAADRMEGEWFRASPALLDFIKTVRDRGTLWGPCDARPPRATGGTLLALDLAIRGYCERHKISLSEVAKRSGMLPQALARVLRSARRGEGTVDVRTAVRMAHAIGRTIILVPKDHTEEVRQMVADFERSEEPAPPEKGSRS